MRYKLYYLLRARSYIRIGFLRAMRHRYLHGRLRAAEKMAGLWNCRITGPRCRPLSARRFDESAVLAATGVAEPAAWPQIDVSVVTYNSARWSRSSSHRCFAQRAIRWRRFICVLSITARGRHGGATRKNYSPSRVRASPAPALSGRPIWDSAQAMTALECEGQSAYCLVTNSIWSLSLGLASNTLRMALADTKPRWQAGNCARSA